MLSTLLILFPQDIPNPPPKPPPGLEAFGSDSISWTKWVLIIGGIVGILISCIGLALAKRNRSSTAVDHATGIVWTLAAIAIGSAASTLIGFFVK